jgi:large conductance mechanosensitive channel
MGLMQEFKAFAIKGNVIDMAVGIVVGVAFNKVVTSLVNDVVMPPIGYVISGVPFKDLEVVLKGPVMDPNTAAVVKPAVAIHYGLFVNTVIEFLIVAFTVFMVVKFVNRLGQLRQLLPAIPGRSAAEQTPPAGQTPPKAP